MLLDKEETNYYVYFISYMKTNFFWRLFNKSIKSVDSVLYAVFSNIVNIKGST